MTPRIPTLDPRAWLALGIVGAALAVRCLFVPAAGRVVTGQRTLKELTANISNAREMAARVAQEEAVLQQSQERYRLLERRVGTEQSVARILEALGAQAREHRLELVALQPRADDEEQDTLSFGPDLTLREIPLTLQLTGRYRHVGAFLGRLADQPFVASVKSLTMAKPETNSVQLSANLVLAVYLARPGAHDGRAGADRSRSPGAP